MQTSQDAFLVLRLSQVQIGLMVKQELNAGEYEREIFFGTSLNEMVQCGFALHILDIDITAGLT